MASRKIKSGDTVKMMENLLGAGLRKGDVVRVSRIETGAGDYPYVCTYAGKTVYLSDNEVALYEAPIVAPAPANPVSAALAAQAGSEGQTVCPSCGCRVKFRFYN